MSAPGSRRERARTAGSGSVHGGPVVGRRGARTLGGVRHSVRSPCLAHGPGAGHPLYLTARADPIIDAGQSLVQSWLAARYPTQGAEALETAADAIVRMTISHLILLACAPQFTAQRLATAALRLLS
ncbi:hypothetical protein [Streptomyces sp. NPDC057428]|uniref:hypothetical protein n=1 Tax=Streptomyces sp. NPDC057428 TaxID=3346129 RepID=UPI0036797189